MNPDDNTYSEFVDSVEQCVQDLVEQHGIDAKVTVEEGGVTTVSISGEITEGKPIELTAAVSADFEKNINLVGNLGGFNEEVELPDRGVVRPRLSMQEGMGPRNDKGVQPEMEDEDTRTVYELETSEVQPIGPLRSKEDLEHECQRLVEE